MYEVANRFGRVGKVLDDYANGDLSMSGHAMGPLRKQVVAMKACHDAIAARIGYQTREATYGTEF
jgi:hypothetical protein